MPDFFFKRRQHWPQKILQQLSWVFHTVLLLNYLNKNVSLLQSLWSYQCRNNRLREGQSQRKEWQIQARLQTLCLFAAGPEAHSCLVYNYWEFGNSNSIALKHLQTILYVLPAVTLTGGDKTVCGALLKQNKTLPSALLFNQTLSQF